VGILTPPSFQLRFQLRFQRREQVQYAHNLPLDFEWGDWDAVPQNHALVASGHLAALRVLRVVREERFARQHAVQELRKQRRPIRLADTQGQNITAATAVVGRQPDLLQVRADVAQKDVAGLVLREVTGCRNIVRRLTAPLVGPQVVDPDKRIALEGRGCHPRP
jgi:hypothetical protein